MDFSRRDFENIRSRVSQLESKLKMLEEKLKVHETKLKPSELFRIIKTEEKGKEIEQQMGIVDKPI